MAEERETTHVSSTGTVTTKTPADERKNEKMTPDQVRARFIQLVDRGFHVDRTSVPLPPGVHGEWVPNDPQSIRQYRDMGFDLDEEYAKKHGLMSNGDGASVFGDTVFMVCPKEIKEVFDEVKQARYRDAYEKRRDGSYMGESSMLTEARTAGLTPLNPELNGREHVVGADEIRQATKK